MSMELPAATVIAAIRETTGNTQEALARRLGVTFATLNRWERGRSEPTRAHRAQIEALASELGISARPHALVIEDDPYNTRLLTALLQAAGADVSVTTDATEGLVMCGKEIPDVVFVDTRMPGMAGDVAEHVRAVDGMSRLLVVGLTDTADEDRPGSGSPGAADIFLRKPLVLEEIMPLLERATSPTD